jgi:hypothetical protein
MTMPSLLDKLSSERQRRFVGRTQEIELFQHAITSPELPFYILHIFGPGGVGKTTLMRQFINISEKYNIPYLYVESRNIEPAPESFVSTLCSLMSVDENVNPLDILGTKKERNIIFIDTYETIIPLDNWLREKFFPHISEQTLVVIAGRYGPGVEWRSDAGWQALLRNLPLRNLAPEDSLVYLTRRDIPAIQHQSVLNFTHGHPLALCLVADVFAQGQEINFQVETPPDIIKTLLERFIQELPTPSHRMALSACAIARITTEALLSQLLEEANVHEIFEWLRGLSFIDSGSSGLFPHDVAREVLIADLRWRNPDFYNELHHRARSYYTVRLGQTQGAEKHRVLFDYMFLHRDNAAIRLNFTWQEHSSLQTDTLKEADKSVITAMVAQYEGEESAKIAAHWMQRQPWNVLVFRDAQSILVGFSLMVALHQASSEDIEVDAGALNCWNYLHKQAPLRPQEGASIFRFWMARDTYQAVSPTQSLIFINFVQYFQKTPGLAYTFLPCAAADAWAPMLNYFDMARIPESDFTVGSRKYGVFGHDWRVIPPEAWRLLLAQREVAAEESSTRIQTVNLSLLVLSQEEFMEAVQEALRNYTRLDALQKNPLLRSRLVVDQVSSTQEPANILQSLLKQASESLQTAPKDEKLYRAVYRTYINPAPTQEQAAELLDLPFSTYRRHLKSGMARIAEILWQREIG